jgi:hypothetical protein
MLAVLARLTLWKTKNKKSYFHGSMENRPDKTHCKPRVSHQVEACSRALFAQAQLEERKYSIGLRTREKKRDCLTLQVLILASLGMLTCLHALFHVQCYITFLVILIAKPFVVCMCRVITCDCAS